MLTHEKVLKVFGPYLDADPDYEVVKTSRGYTLLAWNNRREEWFSAEFCKKYSGRIINIHPSLIPSFCGAGMYGLHVHEAALARGVKVTGATVHFVDAVTDGGPIIFQKAVEIEPDDTPEILQKRVMEQAEHVLLPRAVAMFCKGRLKTEGGVVRLLPEITD